MKKPAIAWKIFPPPALKRGVGKASRMSKLNGHTVHAQENGLLFEPMSEAEQLARAWEGLDRAIEEIDDKDRIIRELQDKLREARRAGRQPKVPSINPDLVGTLVSDVEREHIEWVWPGRLAQGKLTILDGDPGLGKSTLLYDVAARITTGRAMPDGAPTEQGGALILSTEDGIGDTIRPRLEVAGADLARCMVVQTIPEEDGPGRVPVLPDDLPLLEHAARRVDARLLVIDPLMAHLGSETNSYRDQDVRRALAPVSEFAERCGLAVVVVRHLNKTGGGSPIYRGGGSIGIIGAARVGLLVGRDPEDEDRLVLASTKNNLAHRSASLAFRVVSAPDDPDTSTIEWEGSCPLGASDLLSAPSRGERTTAIDEAAEWLKSTLADGPRLASEMYAAAEAAGIKKRVLQKARHRVAETERVGGISGSGHWVWSLREAKVPTKIPKMPSSEEGHLRNLSGHLSEPEGPTLHKGQWVRTPKGEGRVLQVFEQQVTVHVADKALQFPPEDIQPIDEAPF